jgi:threonine/homoserine/homoserine lactone efflux protein
MKAFKSGLATGLLLQLAIGPVFFYIINLTLQRTVLDGLVAVLAATIVDYVYISLAILGTSRLLERTRVKGIFAVFSSAVLIIFGAVIIQGVVGGGVSTAVDTVSSDLLTSFTSVFLLTISSPLTIVFFTSLFAAKAVEYGYTERELLVFGLGTGSATIMFLGSSVILISLVGAAIPVVVTRVLNLLVGILLVGYGAIRLARVPKNSA